MELGGTADYLSTVFRDSVSISAEAKVVAATGQGNLGGGNNPEQQIPYLGMRVTLMPGSLPNEVIADVRIRRSHYGL